MMRLSADLADRYTQAYIAAALAAKLSWGDMTRDLQTLMDLSAAVPAWANLLADPTLKSGQRQKIVQSVLSRLKLSDITSGWVRVVVANGRGRHVSALVRAAHLAVQQRQGLATARVETATPLPAEVRQKLAQILSTWSEQKVTVDEKIDPSVIGGLRVRLHDLQIDDTVAGKLARLKQTLRVQAA